MSVIIEDGSGVPNAESYISVGDMDDYASRYGITEWPTGSTTAVTTKKEIALRRAAQYVDNKYGPDFSGQRLSQKQGLLWPRSHAFMADGSSIPENSVPACIKAAQCEAARLTATDTQLTAMREAGPVLKRKKTDVLEKEWFEGTAAQAPVFGNVDAALSPLFGQGGDFITTARLGRC